MTFQIFWLNVFLRNKRTGWVWMDGASALISQWKLDSLCCTFPNSTKFNLSKYSQILLTRSNISDPQTELEHFYWLQSWPTGGAGPVTSDLMGGISFC